MRYLEVSLWRRRKNIYLYMRWKEKCNSFLYGNKLFDPHILMFLYTYRLYFIILIIIFGCLERGLLCRLALNSLDRPGWPQSCSIPPASVSRVLRLQECTIRSSSKFQCTFSHLMLASTKIKYLNNNLFNSVSHFPQITYTICNYSTEKISWNR